MSRRASGLLAFALAIWGGILTVYVGPTYLAPLPMWAKVALVLAGGLIIATIAIYSRRRSRREPSSL